jgi:uncharacterized protein
MRSGQRIPAIILAFAAPFLVAATSPELESNGTLISIGATGTAPQETQLATMQAGVNSFATSAGRAWQNNAAAISKLKSQLAAYGVAPEDVRTTNLQLSPVTKYEAATKYEASKEIRGFEVRHDLTVVFRDIRNAGPILDALVDAGANQVSGPRFSWQASEQAAATARAAAIREANERAQFYARALGLKVKRVVSMHDGGGYASGDAIVVTGSRVATQIAPGEDRVRVSIQAEYELTP